MLRHEKVGNKLFYLTSSNYSKKKKKVSRNIHIYLFSSKELDIINPTFINFAVFAFLVNHTASPHNESKRII